MRAIDPEALLAKLAEADTEDEDGDLAAAHGAASPSPPTAVSPTEAVLVAYREDRLSAAEAERIAGALASDPALRRRLIALGGMTRPQLSPRVREAVLAAAGTAPRPGLRPRLSRRRAAWVGAAAAAALLAVAVLPWLLGRQGGTPARPLPEYAVEVSGLAAERDGPRAGTTAAALAGTRVRIVATAEGEAVAGVEYGLYRQAGDRFERLPAGGPIRFDATAEAAVFEAEAAALVGRTPGRHTLWVVVARHGELPAGAELAAGGDLARGGSHRMMPVVIVLGDDRQ